MTCWDKVASFLLNEKRVCKLLGLDADHFQHKPQQQKYILACDGLCDIQEGSVVFSAPCGISFKAVVHHEVSITVLFGAQIVDGQIKAQTATVPQQLKESTDIQSFEVLCRNTFLKTNSAYVLISGMGAVSDSEVCFQMVELDLSDKMAVKVVNEVVRVQNSYYELQKIFGADTPGGEGGQACCICFDEHPSVVALPCRHLILCAECAGAFRVRSQECPLCRGQIEVLVDMDEK